MEAGESLEAAVVREVREETGLRTRVVCELCVVSIAREGYDYLVHEFLVVPVAEGIARAGDDATDVRWVRRDELAGLGVLPDALSVIDQGLAVRAAAFDEAAAPPKHGRC